MLIHKYVREGFKVLDGQRNLYHRLKKTAAPNNHRVAPSSTGGVMLIPAAHIHLAVVYKHEEAVCMHSQRTTNSGWRSLFQQFTIATINFVEHCGSN